MSSSMQYAVEQDISMGKINKNDMLSYQIPEAEKEKEMYCK